VSGLYVTLKPNKEFEHRFNEKIKQVKYLLCYADNTINSTAQMKWYGIILTPTPKWTSFASL
jgi:hypothetical protein